MQFDPNIVAQYGFIGVACLALAWSVVQVFKLLNDSQNSRWQEARNDLADERKSRHDHESQITQLLSELVKSSAEQSRQITEQREAMDSMAEAMKQVVEELKRLKDNK